MEWYKIREIPKRGRAGGRRRIYVAKDELRSLQKQIRDTLGESQVFPPFVNGFVRGRSIISNAKLHLGASVLINIDIEAYFESISKEMIVKVFKFFGARDDISEALAEITTCEGHLAAGTVSAPVLSNLAFRLCDNKMWGLAQSFCCSYSRYVDDITFSGNYVPDLEKIDAVLADHGFARNKDKTSLQKRGWHQYVTGLTVFDRKMPRIPKAHKRGLRQTIHYAARYGLDGHLRAISSDYSPDQFISRYDGLMRFYASVEPDFIARYRDRWEFIKGRHYESRPGRSEP